jgi:hypothetical protein
MYLFYKRKIKAKGDMTTKLLTKLIFNLTLPRSANKLAPNLEESKRNQHNLFKVVLININSPQLWGFQVTIRIS